MAETFAAPRRRRIDLPGRGGAVSGLEFGPAERPIDIVFSHANGFNALTYRTILAPAGEGLRILAYDLRGHGFTELPAVGEGRRDWSDLSADLVALLEALDVRDVVLAGHSMGATTSLLAAAQAPERVGALALFEPVIMPRERMQAAIPPVPKDSRIVQSTLRRRRHFPSLEAAVASYVGRGAVATWPTEIVADYVEGGMRPLPDGGFELACAPEWEASGYMAQDSDTWGALERIAQPTRILKAEHQSTAWLDPGQIPDSRVSIRTVENTTHFLPMERPDAVVSTLVALRA